MKKACNESSSARKPKPGCRELPIWLPEAITTEEQLTAICVALIGDQRRLSAAERAWAARYSGSGSGLNDCSIKEQILQGMDPLGTAFGIIRTPVDRRKLGQTNTPLPLVGSMLRWISHQGKPSRIVDIGAGSGRFTITAATMFPNAQLVSVEIDPLAALMLRANLQTLGLADRVKLLVDDFRQVSLSKIGGQTAFVGNPPYVRHHEIDEKWKSWYRENFAQLRISASALAGLHLHFFLKTALLAQPSDIGALITSAEWLDVNYGSALRELLMADLGGIGLHVLEPTIEAFPGTATTAAITCFRVGEKESPIRVRSVSKLPKLNSLSSGIDVPRSKFSSADRWSIIIRGDQGPKGGDIPLGDIFAVHRGQVTGANWVWIAGEHASDLPDRVLIPAVTKAKDLIKAGALLSANDQLRRVVDLPVDLETFNRTERKNVDRFLDWAREEGADSTYIAQHRRAWWAVGLKPPAPILCTYMARRAPQFTVNGCQARHINVAHGLYPKQALSPTLLRSIANWLNKRVSVSSGRTYAGGLTKFEPKELERLLIPKLEDFER